MSQTYARDVRPVGVRMRGFGWRPVSRKRPVIDGLDLDVAPGERVLLAGPSGAGKSTVLAALAGVLGSTMAGDLSGRVDVDGRVGLLLQNPYDSVVADRLGRDVAFGMENAGTPRELMWPRVRSALDAVRLAYPVEHPTAALSGGETQRLALAGMLALRPGLLLLDEPTSMLDEHTARSVREAVLDAVRLSGASLVVVEHRIAAWLPHVDRVVVLDADGHADAGTPPERFARERAAELAAAGVWMPGVPAPQPLTVPVPLVEPASAPAPVRASGLRVDLRTRSIRGSVTAHALRGVDALLQPGTLTAFTGPSGSGKSTLLAALAGLITPTLGSVAYGDGRDPHRLTSSALAQRTGWVPQNPEHGFVTSAVRDEVAATAHALGRTVDVDAVLELFGLAALANTNPYLLSGGEQRRLAVAAGLAHRPPTALLDEPTVGQDRRTWAAVTGWLLALRDAGGTVGVATHDRDLVDRATAEHPLRDGVAA